MFFASKRKYLKDKQKYEEKIKELEREINDLNFQLKNNLDLINLLNDSIKISRNKENLMRKRSECLIKYINKINDNSKRILNSLNVSYSLIEKLKSFLIENIKIPIKEESKEIDKIYLDILKEKDTNINSLELKIITIPMGTFAYYNDVSILDDVENLIKDVDLKTKDFEIFLTSI